MTVRIPRSHVGPGFNSRHLHQLRFFNTNHARKRKEKRQTGGFKAHSTLLDLADVLTNAELLVSEVFDFRLVATDDGNQ